MSPDSLIHSFKREVIYRRPQDFKIPALRDVVNLFPEGICPFVAGFGNRNTDIESYIAVGVPPAMIFIIDPKGAIHRTKSIHRTTYMLLNDQVEHMFPPFSRRESRAHPSYGEFHFWRKPIRKLENSEKQADQSADREEQGTILKADHLVGISLDST
jgi:phosphatidate phosphatase LPIN